MSGMRFYLYRHNYDTFVHDLAKKVGMAAKMAESKKINKCKDLVNNFEFMPLAVKILDSLGTESLKFIEEIGKRIQENTGEKKSNSIPHSVHLNVNTESRVASILGTVGATRKLDEIYDLITPLKLGD